MEYALIIGEILILAAIGIGVLLVKNYLPSYLTEKGKNFATKEDIEEITHQIEGVKAHYASELEALRASLQVLNQLRTAVIDKRLEKHQEAYSRWTNLFWSLHDGSKLTDAIKECQEWWNNNCLYLDSDSRLAFKKAYLLASNLSAIPNTDVKIKQQWFTEIQKAGEIIVAGVNLPTIGEEEGKKAEIKTTNRGE